MRLFSRRRRKAIDPYVPPDTPAPLPSLDAQIDEGLLILIAGVRLAVKNQAILWTLREQADFDRERYCDAVRRQLLAAAAEVDSDAHRADLASHGADQEPGLYNQQYADEPTRLRRKARVLHALASRVRELVHDDAFVGEIATAVRDAAWEDIGAVVKHTASLTGPLTRTVRPAEREIALHELRIALRRLQGR